MITQITKKDYFIIQKMFNATSSDSKSYLSKIYYNVERSELFCSNGSIARVHKIEFVGDDKPEHSFALLQKDFIYSKSQFEMTYGKKTQTFNLEYEPVQDGYDEVPKYENFIWDIKNAYPTERLAIDLNDLLQFSRAFQDFEDYFFKMYFQESETGSILVYGCEKNDNNRMIDYDPFHLVGILSPIRILCEENRQKFNIEKV